MTDHCEELAALAAGGQLSEDELHELREHCAVCPECEKDAQELRNIVHWGLPLTQAFSGSLKESAPPDGARARFLARARSEGVRLSPEVATPQSPWWFALVFRPAMVAALAAAALLGAFVGPSLSRRLSSRPIADDEVASLKSANAELTAQLTARDQELADVQRRLRDLNGQLAGALKTADNYRKESQLKGVQLGQSASQSVQLLEELQNREQQLQASTEELAHINQLRATDKASLDAQRVRIREISDQLRIADATLDAERQLSAAGQDIRELLVSRQLHVVDVRDTDENGKPSQAFGRVFLTEGKSLMFFAFDLNDPKVISAKAHFQVWGEQIGQNGSLRVLGVLSPDDKAENRWALKVANPSLLSNVNSVFVTVSASPGDHGGEKLLNAYLGQPNHT